jgi:hypothetical protein
MDLVSAFSARTDYHQLPSYARVMEGIHWDVIPVSGSYVFVKRVGPISFAKLQRPAAIHIDELVSLQKKLHIAQLFLEPALTYTHEQGILLEKAGFARTNNHHAYTKTYICDISGSESVVLRSFSKTMQYQIRRSLHVGVEYVSVPFAKLTKEEKENICTLHTAWSKERKVLGYPDDFLYALWNGFSNRGEMVLAYKGSELHGVLFLLYNGPIGMYFYQFSSNLGRKSLYIPSGLAYQGIVAARRNGCTIFDLCSCFDERYPTENIKWQGFSEHKLRFHPTPIYYPGAFVRQFPFSF